MSGKITLQRIEENEIAAIIASHYGISKDSVCLYHDYKFVRRGDDKKRRDFVYGIVTLTKEAEP